MRVKPAPATLRNCFVTPIPELEEGAGLLSEAADALLCKNAELARACLLKANKPVLHAYATRIMGRLSDEIHRYKPLESTAGLVANSPKITERMPGAQVENQIYRRDGYRCRYCGCKVVSKKARDRMRLAVPDAIPWGASDKDKHAAFYALLATVDHLIPHARGGTNDEDNLLTACWPCNFGKMNFLIEELSIADPRLRSPVCDSWDGLTRVLTLRQNLSPASGKNGSSARRAALGSSLDLGGKVAHSRQSSDAWFSRLDHAYPGSSGRLLELLESCKNLGVSWSLGSVLIVRLTVGTERLDVFGVEAEGEVEIPWMLFGRKEAFRRFAIDLSQAIPGASAYETAKMWRVRGPDRRVNVSELLEASTVIRASFESLMFDLAV